MDAAVLGAVGKVQSSIVKAIGSTKVGQQSLAAAATVDAALVGVTSKITGKVGKKGGGVSVPSEGAPVSVEEASKSVKALDLATSKKKYKGGLFKHLDTGKGIERHHMPADSISKIERKDGPAIQMEKSDHRKTSSYGNSKSAQMYRAKIREKIDSNNMRGAMADEILDVKKSQGVKYNEAMIEMLDKAKQSEYLLKQE